MAFRWRADGCPFIVVSGPSHPSSTKKKRCQSLTPSNKNFWIRARFSCHNVWCKVTLFLQRIAIHTTYTVKPVLSGYSKETKNGFQDRLSLNAGQKFCRMLQENSTFYLHKGSSGLTSICPKSYHLLTC